MFPERDLRGLEHRPYGDRHPYKQQPVERFPRAPVAGEPVTLGVATWPRGAAASLWAEWQIEGSDERGRADGEPAESASTVEEDSTYWRVPLPAFASGQRVLYRLYARGGERHVASRPFSFSVAGWRPLQRVERYHCRSDAVELLFAKDLEVRPRLTLTFSRPGHFQWAWGIGNRVAGEDANGALGGLEASAYQVVEENAEGIRLAAGRLLVLISFEPYRLEIWRDGEPLLVERAPTVWLRGADGQPLQIRQSFASPRQEAFYGFGERFNVLNQRGQRLDVRVFEAYKKQGTRTYIPVPFFLSSQGYGLFLPTNRYVAYDLAASDPEAWSFQAELDDQGQLGACFIAADDPTEILTGFTDLTGKPTLPPVWSFGPWMSSNDWNSQALVMEQVRQTQEHSIPATVLVIEAWSDEVTFYIWNDARYKPRPGHEAFCYDDFTFAPDGRWPAPKDMIDELHRQGIRVLLWQIPVLKHLPEAHPQQDNDEAYMLAQGYCVHEADGEPYHVRPYWFRDSLVWDVTNAAGVEWWLQKRAYLLEEMGVDGFKTDGGEHIWGRELRFSDGRRGDEMWNLYPNLYVGAYHDFARERRSGDAVTFSRAGFTGAQAYPCHWAGDEDSTWEAFRASILAGLSAGISGIPFWGWDLAGFSGEIPTAELFLRATALATFCPVMQYHSEHNARRQPSRDRTPWNIQARTGDDDVIPVFRHFANLRMNLLPYIAGEAWYTSQTGVPLMRAMPLAFPDDPNVAGYPYQFMFGSALLVAPVVEPAQDAWTIYLPPGAWYDFWSGEQRLGGQIVERAAPKNIIPVFVRAGTGVLLNLDRSRMLGGSVGNAVDRYHHLCLQLYPAATVDFVWRDSVTLETFHFRGEWDETAQTLHLALPPLPYSLTLVLPGRWVSKTVIDGESIAQVDREAILEQPEMSGWLYDETSGKVLIQLAPAAIERQLLLSGSRP